MMKKWKLKFFLAIVFFLGFSSPVFAKEMTLEELGKLIDEKQPNANHAFVIGKYVFTSLYENNGKKGLDTKDIMLAARSIETLTGDGEIHTDKIYEKMKIHQITKKMSSDWKSHTWEKESDYVGGGEAPDTYQIRYIDYQFIPEETKAKVELTNSNDEKYKKIIEEDLKFTGGNSSNSQNLQLSDDWKLTGLLLKNTTVDDSIFKDDEKTGYYFALSIKAPKATDKTIIKVKGAKKEKKFTYDKFDIKNGEDNTDPGIAFLYSVDPKKKDDKKKLEITVDYDGEDSQEYAPTIYTIDYSGITFQEDSRVENIGLGSENATDQDKNIIKDWGYEENKNKSLTLSLDDQNHFTYNLKGTLIEQMLNSAKAFGEKNKLGYYFDFTFVLPEGSNKNNVKISQVNDEQGSKETKIFQPDEFDEKNNLTILFRFKPETTKCTNHCKIYYKVDLDGEGKKYLPVIYSIDYSGVTFEKSSVFTVEGITDEDKDEYDNSNWYDTNNGYSVQVEKDQNEEKKYHITGVLPIFNDEEKDFNSLHTFDTEKELYYLGLLLKLSNAEKIQSENSEAITVKFFHNDGSSDDQFLKVTADDFESSHKLYLLKALCEIAADSSSTIPDSEKIFTITVDLDGDEETYAPYTVTIDWSGLVLQKKSSGNSKNYDVVLSEEDLGTDTKAKEELKSYGYQYENDRDISLKEGTKDLTGTIKEQKLKETAGFKDDNKGYFVPIKVEFPGKDNPKLKDYADKWTLILNTEDNRTFEYQPSSEEYQQGWVMVLFKIYRDTKTEIKYQIDFDGLPKDGKGYNFVPEDYQISYADLAFKTANQIKFNYTDKNGKQQSETAIIYEGEQLGHDLAATQNMDYRTFDGWYNQSDKVEVEKVLEKDEDLELTAHWKINSEKFISEVITDLNSSDETYSNDFSKKFNLTQNDENKKEITINIERAKVPLTELAETSIPGAIAYALQTEEIKDITLTAGKSNSVTFKKDYTNNSQTYDKTADRDEKLLGKEGTLLKKEIIKGTKEIFNKELEEKEETATLDQLEYMDKSFSIQIGTVDNTVTLVKDDGTEIKDGTDKTYTFKFDSDFVVVDEEEELGATDIRTALTSAKNYHTIYVDGNLNLSKTLDINATDEVVIKPVDATSKNKTITVSNQDYAIDVKSGTVNISNLKITGGKKAELRIEEGANVTVDNIDVSGNITPVESKDEKMHAGIIVRGNLTINSKITNENEKYGLPTVATVTSYSYPTDKELEGERHDDETLAKAATINDQSKMAKNDRYHIVKRNEETHIDLFIETYYGSFYYNNPNNAKIYLAGIIDQEKASPGPYDYIKIYYYDEDFDLSGLGYQENQTPTGVSPEKVFKNFTLNDKVIKGDGSEKVQNILNVADTAHIVVNYQPKPSATLTFQNTDGLEGKENRVSGTLKTQSEDGKYYIPITLKSEKFQDNQTTIQITNPNGESKTYTYSSTNEDGIVAKISTDKTIHLNLEAIKSSQITGEYGKVYTIILDIDGNDTKYQEETYTVDYSQVTTLEEIINTAAEKTEAANSLTYTNNSKVKDNEMKYTYRYDKEKGLTLYNDEEYSFQINKVDSTHEGTASLVLRKLTDSYPGSDERPTINGWEFSNQIQRIGMGIYELQLFIDMKNNRAIKDVVKKENHTYEVTLDGKSVASWLNISYIGNPAKGNNPTTDNHQEIEDTVKLTVVLDEKDQYVKSFKTNQNFAINDTYPDNHIDVTINQINETTIDDPYTKLGKGSKLTKEEIMEFYQKVIQWRKDHNDVEIAGTAE